MACFLLLVNSQVLRGVAEATSAEEPAAEQTLMIGSTSAVEKTAAPQHQHGRGSAASAMSSNAAGGLWSSGSRSAVARRLLPGGAGHSCGSSGGQGCSP
ncbi:hypothetical protein ZWY2020_053661 [Hordeum vulgare]|nr:hypothetical protein ZWY2020_053656 [Hordeum vulgare]KAI4998319.1 hypothetical protein ZWY2020_053661 [Hordeum vulgare]